MPSTPGAGLLVYRRGAGGVEVLLFRRVRPRPAAGGRESLHIPVWELDPPVGAGAAAGAGVPAGAGAPAGRAALPFDTRQRVKQRAIAQRSLEQLLDHARSGFAALTGREALGPFLPLGGVKMRLHRVVYVWACETAEAPAPIIPAGAGRASAAATSAATLGDGPALRGASRVPFGDAEFLPLAEARSLIEPQQRRFLDQLEGLLTGPAS